jgi:methyl-accepting chemotaxis protein
VRRCQEAQRALAQERENRLGGVATALAGSAGALRTASGTLGQTASMTAEEATEAASSATVAGAAVSEAETNGHSIEGSKAAADSIKEVARLIADIAARTNLLALDATIEAARSGEAGRGFAVAAGKAKALASQSAKATAQIGARIGTMRQATHRFVGAVGRISATVAHPGEIAQGIAAAGTRQAAGRVGRVKEAAATTQTALTGIERATGDVGQQGVVPGEQVARLIGRLRQAG